MKLNDKKLHKLGIAVPCRDQVHSLFSYSLANLIKYNTQQRLNTQLFMLSGSLIAEQRHRLAESCIREQCSHILWLDSDMTFLPTLATDLLLHQKPIVACNYSTRTEPRKSVAYKTFGDWSSWLDSASSTEDVSTVEAIGMGCILTDCNVYKLLTNPFFEVQYDHNLKEWIGEDFYFCQKARAAGYEILVDNRLSMHVYHIGISAYTNETLIKP
jgi:Anp1